MMEIKTVNLGNFSSLRIGGDGQMVTVTTIAELVQSVMYANKHSLAIHIIGEGTNTFFGNPGNDILFIKMAIRGISFEEKEDFVFVTAASGELFDDIVKFSVERGLWGIENLSYIPGTVGAAPVQNIGAYGAELADSFVSLSALDTTTLNTVEINKEACCFGYRDSLFKQEKGKYIILSVTLRLRKEQNPVLSYKPLDGLVTHKDLTSMDVRNLVVATRKEKLPDYKEYPNTGSFFKNPVVSQEKGDSLRLTYPDIPLIKVDAFYKIPAAWLIEHVAEMKGVRRGDVGTWPTQPLVMVNYGKADTEDLLSFSAEIIEKIKAATGVVLEREVNFVG